MTSFGSFLSSQLASVWCPEREIGGTRNILETQYRPQHVGVLLQRIANHRRDVRLRSRPCDHSSVNTKKSSLLVPRLPNYVPALRQGIGFYSSPIQSRSSPPPPLPPLLLCSIFILFHSASSLLPRRLFPFEPSASSQSYRLRPLKCKVAIEEPIDLVYSLYTSISAESRQRELPGENKRGAWEENATAGLEGTLVAIFLAPDAMCFSLLLLMPRW